MQTIEMFRIEKTGDDYLLLGNDSGTVRVSFADGCLGTKEENAGFFRGLEGKPAAIPIDGPFFVGVDFKRDQISGGMQTVPYPCDIATVERL
jgi:hypothetical protein